MNVAQNQYISAKQVIGLFFQAYEGALDDSWVPRLSNRFASSVPIELYAGVGNAPAMREWVGGRLAKQLAEYRQLVANKPYEATLEVTRNDLRRDKTGQLEMKIQQLALRAAEHDEVLLSALIDAGATLSAANTCYDAKPLFSTTHSAKDSGTIDNNISVDISALATGGDGTHGTTTAPSAPEIAYAVQAAMTQMYGFKDDQGQPVNHKTKEIVIMVPSPFSGAAELALSADSFPLGVPNPLKAQNVKKTLVINPRLSWTTKLAIFRADAPAKPLLVQVEEEPIMEVVGEGSEHTFKNATHLYGVRKQGAVAPWDPNKCVLVTLT